MKDKTLSVRMQGELFEKAVAVAKASDVTLGEVVRTAVNRYVSEVMESEEFAKAAEAQREYWTELLNA